MIKQLMTYLLGLCLILAPAPSVLAEEHSCSDSLRIYACNWTDREMVVWVTTKDKSSNYVFNLAPLDTIGNPENYSGTLTPNCYEFMAACGTYDVYYRYYGDNDVKHKEVKFCSKMPQPIELDFEP